MTTSFTLTGDDQGQVLSVVFSDGDMSTIEGTHPNFSKILGYLVDTPQNSVDEDHIRDLSDLVYAVGTRLTALSERVAMAGNTLLFDGDEVASELGDHIVRLLREQDENGWKPLVNFMEKVAQNPSENSRLSLYSWINGRNLTITEDGDFVAYKGVQIGTDGESLSISAGGAFVNGEYVKGHIPNPDGAVITMPRSKVNADTRVGCSTGLHAGTWSYASGFARGRVLEVHINPRDVVSVPDDCSFQKLRVSQYTVVSSIDQEYTATTVYNSYDDDEDDYEDEDDYWGENEYEDNEPHQATEAEEWDEEWSHDPKSVIRRTLRVPFGVTPDEWFDVLVDDGLTTDQAEAAIWPED